MSRSLTYLMITLLAPLFIYGCNSTTRESCQPGDAQSCLCSDNTTAEQVCNDDGSGWETCDCENNYSYWNDPATNLTWQDPQKDAYKVGDEAPGQPDAARYCEELVLGGYNDWRLPDIDELRTLVRGHETTMADGECPLTEGSKKATMFDETCSAKEQYEGPGDGGCYWASELTGPCDKEDVADEFNKPLEFVSSTKADDDEFWVACILFDRGSVSYNHIYSYADVRCVREGPTPEEKCAKGLPSPCFPGETRTCIPDMPSMLNGNTGVQVCADGGACWGPCEGISFTPSPPIVDICDQCDQVEITVNVPEKLAVKPVQLMTFLYAPEPDGSWIFPPMHSPDAGTHYNQVIYPDIDVDTPFVATVPACTYYQERCVSGEFYILVFLLNSERMPPFPIEGEYAWGMVQEPITLGDGPQKTIEVEVTVVECGADTNGNNIGDNCEN